MTQNRPPADGDDAYPHIDPVATPGVYIRRGAGSPARGPADAHNNNGEHWPHHELDVLWSGTRSWFREDRPPLLMFATGVMAGILITAAFFLLMFGKQIFTPLATTPGVPVQSNNPMTAPVETLLRAGSSTPDAAPEAPGQTGQGPTTSSGNAPTGSKIVLPGERGGTVPSGGALGTLKGAASYEVQSGDTLSSIAGRVYGDSSPAMVQRIQKANQMANPHALSLGQKLIIPPKEY